MKQIIKDIITIIVSVILATALCGIFWYVEADSCVCILITIVCESPVLIGLILTIKSWIETYKENKKFHR